jgi:hypothetical protein
VVVVVSATDVPLVSITTPDTVQTGGEQQGVALNRDEDPGGVRLLVNDAGVACLLLNEARYRVVARLFGVPRDQSFLVTVIALGTLAGALHDRAARVLAAPGTPSLGDTVLAAGVLKESVHGIAGAWSKDTPLFNTLVAIAMLGTLARPVLRVSFRDIKASSHTARVAFDHRYGHLVRRGRHRR